MGFFDFLSPPAANVPTPQISTYAPQNQPGADQAAFGGIGNLGSYNLYGGAIPQVQGITQGLVNNPYAQQFQQGANQAGQMGQAGAMNAFGGGAGLYGLAGQTANAAFDPQNALYNRTLQQVQDQTRAGQSARGIANTPYGAGLENQNINNFNMDWNNQQLQRMISGGQATGNLVGQGAGLQSGAAGQYGMASGMPYNAYQGIGQGQIGALGQAGQFGQQGSQIPQQQIADYMQYLGWGTGAQSAGNTAQLGLGNFNLNQANQGFNQQQTMFSDIGKVIGGLGSLGGGGPIGGGAGSGSFLNSLGSAAFDALGFAPFAMFSDERVKDDIVPVGELYDRTPVYSYRYKGDPTPRIGLIAQDVEKRRPDAVFEVGGIKAVDYGKATEWSRGLAALSAWG